MKTFNKNSGIISMLIGSTICIVQRRKLCFSQARLGNIKKHTRASGKLFSLKALELASHSFFTVKSTINHVKWM